MRVGTMVVGPIDHTTMAASLSGIAGRPITGTGTFAGRSIFYENYNEAKSNTGLHVSEARNDSKARSGSVRS